MYLNCHSYFSLRFGTFPVQELVEKAKEMNIKSIALTDINNTSGVFDFVKACIALDIKPIIGVEFRNKDELKYVCIAKNNEGFREINIFLTEYLEKEKDFPTKAPAYKNAITIYPLQFLEFGTDLESHEYIGVRFWEINSLYRFQKKKGFEKTIAIHPVTFSDKKHFNLHRLLRAVDHNCLLSKLPKFAEANASEFYITETSLIKQFNDYPDLVKRTNDIINTCSFEFDYKTPKNKKLFTNCKEDDIVLLTKIAKDGIIYRYGNNNKQAIERVEKELKIIYELNFSSYFLITHDIIRHARSKGYYHVGRGSGANSIVAYCMGITDVDPLELDLYFERFINPHRTSPPDFDVDFSWDERDEIIEYVFKRYGKEYVCLLATYNTFQFRSAIRELAKVFGLPKTEIDEMIKYPEKDHKNEYTKYILGYSALLEDYPNNLSIHAGGILISEEPLSYYTALVPMPKGFPICSFDMYVAEDIGFAKFDVLSQRGLGHIKMAVDIIRENKGIDIDIHTIEKFKADDNIKRQLQRHETMGCFYVESPAMRQLIWKLKCDNYITLVAASSIIRPGVSSSGMMREYILRYHNPHNVPYLHPKMKELLSETFGVMVYQEDVLKVAQGFANLTLAEGDILRRAMSGKFRSRVEFERLIEKWFTNCKELGYPDELAKEVWRQIESFSGYSFSKAHSASFAAESYQSLYLKTYFPLEFMVAVVNNFGGFYSAEYYLHEARRYGGIIEAPDINMSQYRTSISGNIIHLGWVHVKTLEYKAIESILLERNRNGDYISFFNFVKRVDVGLAQLVVLIRIGAFRNFGIPKKELLWEAHSRYNNTYQVEVEQLGLGFTEEEPELGKLPPLYHHPLEDAYDQMEILEFPLCSPFDLVNESIKDSIISSQLFDCVGKKVRIYGYLVNYKRIRAKNHKEMAFGYFIDYAGEFFDTTHFPSYLEQFPFRGKGVYCIEGFVAEEFGFPSIDVRLMRKVEIKPDPRTLNSLPFELNDN